MLTSEQLEEIKRFNRNIEWIKKNRQSVPLENPATEWIKVSEALSILERGRTWLQCRLIKPEEATQPMNVNWFLIRGLDWEREGNQLTFKRVSIQRLKNEMRRLGEVYEDKIRS